MWKNEKEKKYTFSNHYIYIYIYIYIYNFFSFFSTPFSLLSVSFHPIPSFSVTLSPSPSLSLLAALFLCPYSPFYHYFLSFLSLVFNIYSFFILSFLLHFSFSLLIHFSKYWYSIIILKIILIDLKF